MAMRRRYLFAAVAVAAPLAAIVSAHGCSSEPPFESVCLWVDDPTNCYRKFHQDAENNGVDCKPLGSPTPANSDPSNLLGIQNGGFLNRAMLDVCFISGGGQVVLDPPIDLTMIPTPLTSGPVTYKFTFVQPDGSECGNATYTSPHGFSFTIEAPDSGAPASADAGVAAAADAGTPIPYGSYTEVIEPGREAFDVTCPSGESHHFDLEEVAASSDGVDGGAVTSCGAVQAVVPRASFVIIPGAVGVLGAVSFTIVWPPVATNVVYPDPSVPGALQNGTPIVPDLVTYFNCTIPAALASCMDGVKDDSETDIDCGGPEVTPGCPARCMAGQGCVTDCDCDPSTECLSNAGVLQCTALDAGMPPARNCSNEILCMDGRQDGTETDVDCGGGSGAGSGTGGAGGASAAGGCPGCPNGKKCIVDTDCLNGFCASGICKSATCTDGLQNGGESDVDCGGPTCPKCADGKTCTVNGDCLHNFCNNGLCATADCTDKVKDGNETDVDCGGPTCPPCADDLACKVDSDCVNKGCVMLVCRVPTCTDMTKDGAETDVDCGGGACPKCGDGLGCAANTDCLNNVCGPKSVMLPNPPVTDCFPGTCGNGLLDPPETDVDCGGGVCPLCANTKNCLANTDCVSNACVASKCADAACNDMKQDGVETDVDCGGNGNCPRCPVGKKCLANSDCAAPLMTCFMGLCQ